MIDSYPRPDWVVLGGPAPDGKVAVYASKDLNQAELAHEMDHPWDIRVSHPFREPARRITLTVEMRSYTVVVADTYADAFRHLFDAWSPDDDRLALDAPQRAIGPA